MAKRYRVKWASVVEINECRGLKRIENPLFIRHKENYIENILLHDYLAILKDNTDKREKVRKWRESLQESIRGFLLCGPRHVGNTLYCDERALDAEHIRRLLSWYHRKRFKGSFHLEDDKRTVVKRGQLVVESSYRNIHLRHERKPYMYKRYRSWKEKMTFVFSEWEMGEVINLLVMDAMFANVYDLQWVRDVYGERADYLPSLQSKDILCFFFWHLIEGR